MDERTRQTGVGRVSLITRVVAVVALSATGLIAFFLGRAQADQPPSGTQGGGSQDSLTPSNADPVAPTYPTDPTYPTYPSNPSYPSYPSYPDPSGLQPPSQPLQPSYGGGYGGGPISGGS